MPGDTKYCILLSKVVLTGKHYLKPKYQAETLTSLKKGMKVKYIVLMLTQQKGNVT